MKIVINIPKEKYQVIKTAMYARVGEDMAKQLIKYIKNGKPLKQEPNTDILDKIRTELTEKRDILAEEARSNTINPLSCYGLDYALLIIDKYKEEIEPQESEGEEWN